MTPQRKSYRDFCRPASPIERSSDYAQPGHLILDRNGFHRVERFQREVGR